MSRLAGLVSFAAAAGSRLVRGALVRLAVRAGSLGGGMSPFLVPLVSSNQQTTALALIALTETAGCTKCSTLLPLRVVL
jgi:hypothetical protein